MSRERIHERRPPEPGHFWKPPARAAVIVTSLVIGVYSLRYALPHVLARSPLPNVQTHHAALIAHAVSAAVALIVGPWQFSRELRRTRPVLHRRMGSIYLAAVAVAWVFSIPLALGALGGLPSTLGFLGLGMAWILSSGAGLAAVKQRRFEAHREWMIRSFALTAAAITLRLYLVATLLLSLPFLPAYRAISWLCWIPNLLAAEMLIRSSPTARQQKEKEE